MTREQQRIQCENKQLIEKQLMRPTAKRFGFKTVSGFVYRAEGDWLYSTYITATYESIHVRLMVKPLSLDTLFWEIFDMLEKAKRQPFSFHVKAAFVPYELRLEDWYLPLEGAEQAEAVLEQAFTELEQKIASHRETLCTIADYRERLLTCPHVDMLNVILCDIAAGEYAKAITETQQEQSAGHSGGFADAVRGGTIYDYILRYCRERV